MTGLCTSLELELELKLELEVVGLGLATEWGREGACLDTSCSEGSKSFHTCSVLSFSSIYMK